MYFGITAMRHAFFANLTANIMCQAKIYLFSKDSVACSFPISHGTERIPPSLVRKSDRKWTKFSFSIFGECVMLDTVTVTSRLLSKRLGMFTFFALRTKQSKDFGLM